MAWYKTGTISIVANSTVVIGTDMHWSNSIYGIGAGQILLIPGVGNVQMFEIASVDSDTQITLVSGPAGAITDSAYAILSFYGGSYADFGRQLSSFLAEYQTLLGVWQQFLTGTADINLTLPDGSTMVLKSLSEIEAITAAASEAGAWYETNKTLIEQSGPNALAASNAASSAAGSETDAAGSATAALASKNAAKTSEDNAKTSETNAKTSETNAAASADAAAAAVAGVDSGAIQTKIDAKANNGANNDITSLTGLTIPLSIAQGGTGATDIPTARNNFGLGVGSDPSFGSLELSQATPFIDFHYGSTTADYNMRIINDASGQLSVGGGSLVINAGFIEASRGLRTKSGADGGFGGNGFNVTWTGSLLEFWIDSTLVSQFAGSTSDRRIKDDIVYLTDTTTDLQTVLSMQPVTYSFSERGQIPKSSQRRGFIAQDLQTEFPLSVLGAIKTGDENLPPDQVTDFLSLDSVALCSVLVGAIKELSAKVDAQAQQIATLQAPVTPPAS